MDDEYSTTGAVDERIPVYLAPSTVEALTRLNDVARLRPAAVTERTSGAPKGKPHA